MDSRPSPSTDKSLPPVEPPSAGFILQLFLIPASIVLIIVGVWLAFNWLAQMGGDPYDYVKALERNSAQRWQVAVNLADALRDPQNDKLRNDAAVARQLSDLLGREIDGGGMSEEAIQLRGYLCNALGEFETPEVVIPVLVKAAGTERDEKEMGVRFAAVKALAVLLSKSPQIKRSAHPEVLAVLLRNADESEPLLRSTAAFGLGAFGGDEARAKLEHMASDLYPDVRYNAATTLARLGDEAATPVIVEMLSPGDPAGVTIEKDVNARDGKRASIQINALRAATELAAKNAQLDVSPLVTAIDRLRAAHPTKSIDIAAREAKDAIAQRKSPNKASAEAAH
jgi:HEAT repeat protein